MVQIVILFPDIAPSIEIGGRPLVIGAPRFQHRDGSPPREQATGHRNASDAATDDADVRCVCGEVCRFEIKMHVVTRPEIGKPLQFAGPPRDRFTSARLPHGKH